MRDLLGVIFFCLTFCTSLWSFPHKVHIYDYDTGTKMDDEVLVFLSNGIVAKLYAPGPDWLKLLLNAKKSGSLFAVTLDSSRVITDMKEMGPSLATSHLQSIEKEMKLETEYIPTVLENLDEARKIFGDARHKSKESQCYNRAHIWSYEWAVKYGVLSSKMWLFFTRKYIRKFNFDWWFHVAPYFHVVDEGKVKVRIADVKYTRGPLRPRQWTDIFMRNDAECPLVSSYSEQANYPETGWCYTMKSTMYYYQPVDLEFLEKFGTEKYDWFVEELKSAYLDAFDIQLK